MADDYTRVPVTTQTTPVSDEVLNYASIIAAIVTWAIIVGAILILVRKLFLCFWKTAISTCECSQNCISNTFVGAFCQTVCCANLDVSDDDPSLHNDINTISADISSLYPPTYDIALNMPKPVKNYKLQDTQAKPFDVTFAADNEGLELHESDPDLPSYSDALCMQQTVNATRVQRNDSVNPTRVECVVEIENRASVSSPPTEQVNADAVTVNF
ncbi:hypothetical protein CAPTEDRAFT_206562 [Capitella teleta]|uniref:Uncharacterized protein n=1 Tax=Capitella teleta TaxID=283909 RepID=R7U2A5_CAPTE|nr:hypothetical protein CAPTEDRAFT_206562 [Capitella teleta]|eukprot:ELU00018.1 hypothetical protein CAPTEDRAFT_206562 [Capitella teleta]